MSLLHMILLSSAVAVLAGALVIRHYLTPLSQLTRDLVRVMTWVKMPCEYDPSRTILFTGRWWITFWEEDDNVVRIGLHERRKGQVPALLTKEEWVYREGKPVAPTNRRAERVYQHVTRIMNLGSHPCYV